MLYEEVWIVIAIFFWVLCAALVVIGLAWIFCYCNYFKWDKEDRYKSQVVKEISEKVSERIEEELYSGGGN